MHLAQPLGRRWDGPREGPRHRPPGVLAVLPRDRPGREPPQVSRAPDVAPLALALDEVQLGEPSQVLAHTVRVQAERLRERLRVDRSVGAAQRRDQP